ncbi:hypothetical protein BZA05DRAFT_404878 [Tricharina praecox]|uniref:uncharacterized protein n=1 Tax=Tricharina praecox TaxID=43433 RepID=UPI002220E758|nr:uncharacterized protein BZA05DRAFT_404878 [Tricharina praecox]KAI5847457.1 hypothetical protein BZA05DRAFT_404878 [Tricharina praecox]
MAVHMMNRWMFFFLLFFFSRQRDGKSCFTRSHPHPPPRTSMDGGWACAFFMRFMHPPPSTHLPPSTFHHPESVPPVPSYSSAEPGGTDTSHRVVVMVVRSDGGAQWW